MLLWDLDSYIECIGGVVVVEFKSACDWARLIYMGCYNKNESIMNVGMEKGLWAMTYLLRTSL